MIIFVLLIIGFLMASGGALGAQIIGAFELAQYVLWFGAIVLTLLVVILVGLGALGGGVAASDGGFGKVGAVVGAGVGGALTGLMGLFAIAISYTQLWLSYYIIDNTPADITAFSDLPGNTSVAIVAFLVILTINFIRSRSSN